MPDEPTIEAEYDRNDEREGGILSWFARFVLQWVRITLIAEILIFLLNGALLLAGYNYRFIAATPRGYFSVAFGLFCGLAVYRFVKYLKLNPDDDE